jgi:hypothetical protein
MIETASLIHPLIAASAAGRRIEDYGRACVRDAELRRQRITPADGRTRALEALSRTKSSPREIRKRALKAAMGWLF